MEALGRLEELIGRAAGGFFTVRAEVGPADFLREARAAMLRGRRAWLDGDVAPNRIDIALAPDLYAAWHGLLPHLEREIATHLDAFVREHGLKPTGRVAVNGIVDATLSTGEFLVRASFAETSGEDRARSALVTPFGWTFTGHRPLRRLVLRETGPLTRQHEHLIVSGNHLTLGDSPLSDLCPQADEPFAPRVITVGDGLYVSHAREGWWQASDVRHMRDGERLRLGPRASATARVVVRDERVTSASLVGRGWTLTLAPGDVIIGRAGETADITLFDATVSARHARLSVGETESVLSDLGSANGTRRNGEPVETAQLRSRDDLRLGRTHLEVIW